MTWCLYTLSLFCVQCNWNVLYRDRRAGTLIMTTCVRTTVHLSTSTVQLCSGRCLILTWSTLMAHCASTSVHVSNSTVQVLLTEFHLTVFTTELTTITCTCKYCYIYIDIVMLHLQLIWLPTLVLVYKTAVQDALLVQTTNVSNVMDRALKVAYRQSC